MTDSFIPKEVFFTKGVGRHKTQLQSFEAALRAAGIEKCNIVSVSSILPPGCKIIPKEEGIKKLQAGQITYIVIARIASNEPNRLMAASVGAAIPTDWTNNYGYLSEHHEFGETDERCGEHAEDEAAQMLATTLGIEFDTNKDWDELKQEFKMSGKIVKTRNIAQSSEGDKNGLWTTVIAAAVFCS